MSYTTMKEVLPTGEVRGHTDLRNGHGTAPYIWGALVAKYIDPEKRYSWGHDNAVTSRLWKMVDEPDLQPCERVALAMTFDRAWIQPKDIGAVAAHLRSFHALHPQGSSVCHLEEIATLLDDWAPNYGLAFHMTSVGDDPWYKADPCPTCGQDQEDERPINVYSDKEPYALVIAALEACDEDQYRCRPEAPTETTNVPPS